MATNFPGSLDSLTNPTSTDGLDSPSHSDQHSDANDAVEALQGKVGVDSSGVVTTLDFLVKQADDPGHGHTTGIAETAITDGALLARLADTETVTGVWTFDPGAFLDKGNHVYDVKAYGAVGDNVTDDITAIQAAVAAAVAAGTGSNAGGMVFFPPGIYNITSPIDIPDNADGLAFVGVNQRVSAIEQQTSDVPVLRSNHPSTHSVKIHGLTLSYATQQTTAETDAYCLQWAKDADGGAGPHQHFLWSLSDLHLQGGYVGMGIRHLDTGEQIAVWGMSIESIWIQDYASVGMYMVSPTAVGMPNNRVDHLYLSCANTTPDSFAIQLSSFEAQFTSVEVNELPDRIMSVGGGRPVSVHGIHIESHTVSTNGSRLFEVSNGTLMVEDVEFVSWEVAATGVEIFTVNTGGALVVDGFDPGGLTLTSGDVSFLNAADRNGTYVRRYEPDANISPGTLTDVRGFESLGNAVQSFADGDTTPSVLGFSVFETANTTSTTITDFDDKHPGKLITVVIADNFTTIEHGTGIFMVTDSNWVGASGDVLQFVYDGSVWRNVVGVDLNQIPDGTAGAPALAFANNTNLGLFRSGSNTIGIATHGFKRFEMFGSDFSIPARGSDELRLNGESAGTPIKWGPGDGTLDTNLYRDSANVLKTDDSLHVGADLSHLGSNAGFFGATPTSQPAALTAADASTVDTTYGQEEADVINNLRTRVNELETKLQALGLLS